MLPWGGGGQDDVRNTECDENSRLDRASLWLVLAIIKNTGSAWVECVLGGFD